MPTKDDELSAGAAAPVQKKFTKGGKTGMLMLRGSALQFISFGCNLVAGFVLMPLLIHGLGERTYGLWALIGTIVGQLGLFDLGFMSTTERYMTNAVARGDQEASLSIYSTSITIFVFLGSLVFAAVMAVVLTAPLLLKSHVEIHEFEIALTISGLNLAWLFPFAVMQGALSAVYRSDAATLAQVSCTVIRTVLTIVAIFLGFGIIAVAISNFLGAMVQRIMMGLMVRKFLPGVGFHLSSVTKKTAKELIGFGRFIFLGKVFDAARYRADNLIVAPLAGIVAVTHYSVAVRLADYFEALIIRVSAVSRPVYATHFTRGEHEELKGKFLTVARLGASICCVFASLAIIFGRPFIRLWLGKGFDDSYYALAILASAMFFSLLQAPSRDVLRAIYKHQFDAFTNGIEVFCNLILTVMLIPIFGIVGAALGTAIPMVIVKALVLPVYVCRTLELSLYRYYLTVGQPALIAVILSAASYALFPIDAIGNFLILVIAMTCFGGLLCILLLYALPRLDKLTLVHAFGRARIQRMAGGKLLLWSLRV